MVDRTERSPMSSVGRSHRNRIQRRVSVKVGECWERRGENCRVERDQRSQQRSLFFFFQCDENERSKKGNREMTKRTFL